MQHCATRACACLWMLSKPLLRGHAASSYVRLIGILKKRLQMYALHVQFIGRYSYRNLERALDALLGIDEL
jgi:hypothetical protein